MVATMTPEERAFVNQRIADIDARIDAIADSVRPDEIPVVVSLFTERNALAKALEHPVRNEFVLCLCCLDSGRQRVTHFRVDGPSVVRAGDSPASAD
jgi:hypothetical protein